MIFFWEQIIKPILELTKPKTIVEIGSAHGLNTTNILHYLTPIEDGQLVSIDPSPQFDVEKMQQVYPHKFVAIKGFSLHVLPTIETCDATLIDGDHNWYTVYYELKQFERMKRFPIIFLHDLEWPYGRRDMYYFPESIPPEFRKPNAKMGILPGVNELVENGHNSSVHHATYEHGERNGVLTAIEDFLQQSSIPLQLYRMRSQFGLGIMMPNETDTDHQFNDAVKRLIENATLA